MKKLMPLLAVSLLSAVFVISVHADEVKEKQNDLIEKQQELNKKPRRSQRKAS